MVTLLLGHIGMKNTASRPNCQTSPNKNKSPNLWHVTSILVCCIFVCTCKTHLALYAWTQYQPVASQQSTNSYKMNEGCWTQRFITPPDCLLYSNKVESTKRYFLFLSVCNTNNNARKWSVIVEAWRFCLRIIFLVKISKFNLEHPWPQWPQKWLCQIFQNCIKSKHFSQQWGINHR